MRRYVFLTIIVSLCLFFTGCLDVILTKNKVKIPDSVEGVWRIGDGNLFEIRKKDDYWANMAPVEKKDKNEMIGITLHKVNGYYFACFQGWNKGKKEGFILPVEIASNTQINLLSLDLSDQDQKDFKETPSNVKEIVFKSFLDNGKIKIVKSQDEKSVCKKVYNLTD